jgi:hypothetical protein
LTYGIGGPTGTFQTSPTFSVPAGTYTVSIKDKNGCITAASPTVVYPRLTAAAVVTKTLDCSSTQISQQQQWWWKSTFTYTIPNSSAPSAESGNDRTTTYKQAMPAPTF